MNTLTLLFEKPIWMLPVLRTLGLESDIGYGFPSRMIGLKNFKNKYCL
jgi:hypothetical protein